MFAAEMNVVGLDLDYFIVSGLLAAAIFAAVGLGVLWRRVGDHRNRIEDLERAVLRLQTQRRNEQLRDDPEPPSEHIIVK